MTDTTHELLVVLDKYRTIISGIDEGDFSKLEKYQLTDYITQELSVAYIGLKKLEKTFRVLDSLSRNMGKIQ